MYNFGYIKEQFCTSLLAVLLIFRCFGWISWRLPKTVRLTRTQTTSQISTNSRIQTISTGKLSQCMVRCRHNHLHHNINSDLQDTFWTKFVNVSQIKVQVRLLCWQSLRLIGFLFFESNDKIIISTPLPVFWGCASDTQSMLKIYKIWNSSSK